MSNKFSFVIFFFFILFAINISAQQEQMDEDFLKSLPDDIRNDFIREMGENNTVKDEVYQAPRTSIETLESNLEQIQLQLKQIERSIDDEKSSNKLQRFGPDFFNSTQSHGSGGIADSSNGSDWVSVSNHGSGTNNLLQFGAQNANSSAGDYIRILVKPN